MGCGASTATNVQDNQNENPKNENPKPNHTASNQNNKNNNNNADPLVNGDEVVVGGGDKSKLDFLLSPTVALNALWDTTKQMIPAATTTTTTSKTTTTTTTTTTTGGMMFGERAANAAHHLRNVFAKPLSFVDHATSEYFKSKEVKTEQEISFLNENLRKNYLFQSLPHGDLLKLISAFEKVSYTPNDSDNNKQVNLIKQGEVTTNETAYFYVLYQGKCAFIVDEKIVGYAEPGDSFGELALLYDCPRAATVTAIFSEKAMQRTVSTQTTVAGDDNNDVILYRVHQRAFRRTLQQADQNQDQIKIKLLDGVDFLKHVGVQQKARLAAVMKAITFQKGDYLVRKGEAGCSWTIIERGTILVKNISAGSGGDYQDIMLNAGQCFGQRAILTGEPSVADAVAQTAGVAFVVDKDIFKQVVGDLDTIVLQSSDDKKLRGIPVIAETTQCEDRIITFLASQIRNQNYPADTVLCEEGKPLTRDAAIYLLREGEVKITSSSGEKTISKDGFFGEDQFYAETRGSGPFISSYTATVVKATVCGVLRLNACHRVLDTHQMGKPQNIREFDSLAVGSTNITLDELKLHRILGAGTFGQTWLCSRSGSDGTKRPYALKVQSKYELCESGQAKAVVGEKNMMAQFHNPFVAGLVSSFHDDKCVYILMDLIQGGELHSIMHTPNSDTMPEAHAKFYIANIAAGLSYLHRLGFVHRDLKPENCLINNKGYAILIDFGFCKKISFKTYTLCGTPLYISPEIILNRGHSWGTDHWSMGVMLYEMLTGFTPFYLSGMSKSDLFKAIVNGKVYPPTNVSKECLNFLAGLLKRDPTRRLGSLADGEDGILEHPWFDIDMDLMFLQLLDAPHVPKTKDPFDVSNFKDWGHVDDKRKMHYPRLTKDQEDIFKNF